ncbi:MAG: HAMP domain-containing sensor histidine kinase [Minwuia sp.]|nr:HAMP domain-containing sensor histidine kinase [Minwuia sp.]
MTTLTETLTEPEKQELRALDTPAGRFSRRLVEEHGVMKSATMVTSGITLFSIVSCLIVYEIIGLDYFAAPISIIMPILIPIVTGFPSILVTHRLVSAMLVRERQGLRQQEALQMIAEEAARQRRKAERSNQATSDFLASMSHELRTPLNAIIGGAEMIRKQSLGPVGDTRYVQTAEDMALGGAHLLRMINDILDLAKLERGARVFQIEAIATSEIIETAVRILRAEAEQHQIAIIIEKNTVDPMIDCDDQAMRQVMLNLLSNAIKFSPPQSTIHLYATQDTNGGAGIHVRDEGVGIPIDRHSDVFEAFTQVDDVRTRSRQGTGLGLALVRSMVEQQGGRVLLTSAPGEGSTFSLAFPPAAKV